MAICLWTIFNSESMSATLSWNVHSLQIVPHFYTLLLRCVCVWFKCLWNFFLFRITAWSTCLLQTIRVKKTGKMLVSQKLTPWQLLNKLLPITKQRTPCPRHWSTAQRSVARQSWWRFRQAFHREALIEVWKPCQPVMACDFSQMERLFPRLIPV